MSTVTQEHRPVAIQTPLGEDALVLRAARVREELSRPFEIECELFSTNTDIKATDLLGKNVTIRLDTPDDQARYFNGYVAGFSHVVGRPKDSAAYRMRIVPWL